MTDGSGAVPPAASTRATLVDNARRIAAIAWPVFVGQVAVLAFSTIDTVMAGRVSATDLAALAIGGSTYISVFIGLMGTVLAIGPIAGQLFGAGRHHDAGREAEQAAWLGLALSVPGCIVLLFPEPILALSRADPEVSAKVRAYLQALAFALPASLVFTAFRGFNVAVSRPKAVMAMQLGGLALKIPVTALLVFGSPSVGIPAFGVAGCGAATAIVMWLQLAAAVALLRRDPFYARFGGIGFRIPPPSRRSFASLLRLGVPMGLSILVETTGFTFMAIFIARYGATPVAGHQIVVNMVALMFMLPLALANATGTLVAQRIGAGDAAGARTIGWHGIGIALALAIAFATTVLLLREPIVSLYTSDAAIAVAALTLVAWIAVFHVVDAAQVVAAFVLRAHRIATMPLVVYSLSVWGIGLAGGVLVAFDDSGIAPSWMRSAQGFWAMQTVGLVVAALALMALLRRRDAQERVAASTVTTPSAARS